VVAPISGTVADREITPRESVKASDKPLMTILNDKSVFATANIYEKDLNQVKKNQQVQVKVASLKDRTFSGRIAVIGSVVEGETRVVPVKAALDNSEGLLKSGMFAELEVLTGQTANASLVIPNSAVVDANGKKIVYVQNGNAFQASEVTLGQTSGDMVEVKSGLFEGDLIVTQRAPQLYAQSLRGGSTASEGEHKEAHSPAIVSKNNSFAPPWWLVLPVGGVVGAGTFWAWTFWAARRKENHTQPVGHSESETTAVKTQAYLENFKQPNLSGSTRQVNEHEDSTNLAEQ